MVLDVLGQRLTFNKLHRVKEFSAPRPQMENRSNIGMPYSGGRSGLSEKTPTGRFVFEKPGIQKLKRNRTAQINVQRLIGNPHRTTAKFLQGSTFSHQNLVMFEDSLFRAWQDPMLSILSRGSLLMGSPPQKTHWTQPSRAIRRHLGSTIRTMTPLFGRVCSRSAPRAHNWPKALTNTSQR